MDEIDREWLFKPSSHSPCLVDVAAAETARTAGVLSPRVYARQLGVQGLCQWGSLQPLIDSHVITRRELPEDLSELMDTHRAELQRHQVVDWLLANADPHRKQFLVVDHDFLVGIDKSQAMRFFPHDRLRWNAHAWWTNRLPPVYHSLFRGARSRRYSLDPKVAIDFAAEVSVRIDEPWLREIWRPVIEYWVPARLVWALGSVRLGRNSVDAVLARMGRRKQRLSQDFRELYYARSYNVWQPADPER